MANTMYTHGHVTVMKPLLHLLENEARLQWRQPWATIRGDIIVSTRHWTPQKYDSSMAICIHCIRPI